MDTKFQKVRKFFNSFHFKIFISFWFFGIVLVVLYVLVGIGIVHFSRHSHEVAGFELKKEVTHFIDHYQKTNQIPYPNSRFFKSYLGASDLPQYLREKVENFNIGYHYLDVGNGSNNQAYYVAVFNLPDRSERFYLVFDYTYYANEHLDFQISRASHRFILALAITGMLGVVVGILISSRLIAPLKSLVFQVEHLKPEKLTTHFSLKFKNDEVGILAATLEKSLKRIEAFIEREKNFTRDASHELRTPLTIIKGAVEVIQQHQGQGNTSLNNPIDRIERSVKNMEDIIEAFLWLARENSGVIKEGSCLIRDVVTDAVEENRYLVVAKPVSVNLAIKDNPRIPVPEIIFRIAAVNLIRNAFLYTNEGQITISVKKDYIQIENTGAEIPQDQLSSITEPFQKGKSSKGFGIGLAIVERLCNQFNLKLNIESDPAHNTIVTLFFNS